MIIFKQYQGDMENVNLDVIDDGHFLGSIYREVANGVYFFHPVNVFRSGWSYMQLREIADKLVELNYTIHDPKG